MTDHPDVLVDLRAWQLAAFAGLRALSHLDLELVGVDEILDRDAESPRCDLLDRRTAVVTETLRVLSALARVRAPAELVHRDSKRLVHLARERAEAHRAGREALDDRLPPFDLLKRDRVADRPEVEQTAQRGAACGVLVRSRRELRVGSGGVVAHGMLEQADRVRIPHVPLAVAPPRVATARRQARGPQLRARVAASVARESLRGEDVEADATDP